MLNGTAADINETPGKLDETLTLANPATVASSTPSHEARSEAPSDGPRNRLHSGKVAGLESEASPHRAAETAGARLDEQDGRTETAASKRLSLWQ